MRLRLGRGWFGAEKPDGAPLRRVRAWAEAALMPEGGAVAVNEIVCPDPACPGTETVILVMAPGRKTRALKVSKPLDAVDEADIRALA